MKSQKPINRRDLFKGAAVAASALIASSALKAADSNSPADVNIVDKIDANSVVTEKDKAIPQIPKRKLGRAKLDVSMLSLGGMFDIINSQMMLKRAIQVGLTYWDTAFGYGGGKSEEGIGMFLKRNPQFREKLFLVTKASGASNSQSRDERLATSLSRLNTNYIDLYYGVHGMSNPSELNDDLRNWADNAKEKGLIKYFGFSTHTNMADCLNAAAEVDWIDAIMTTYNYQMLNDEAMQAAVQKCADKGIALIAMKTQAKGPVDEPDFDLISYFQEKGWSPEQAKLKAVWKDTRFCAICSQMPNFTILNENIAAALDQSLISEKDIAALEQSACKSYCAGCESICSKASGAPVVRDVMRALMYANTYGSYELGRQTFAEIDESVRNKIMDMDFTAAQKACPRKLPIANMMKQAYYQFA